MVVVVVVVVVVVGVCVMPQAEAAASVLCVISEKTPNIVTVRAGAGRQASESLSDCLTV